MKKTYDLSPNFRGGAHAWDHGFFEQMNIHRMDKNPFDPSEYTTVECPRAFYRILTSDLNDPQIKSFLNRANRLSPKEEPTND